MKDEKPENDTISSLRSRLEHDKEDREDTVSIRKKFQDRKEAEREKEAEKKDDRKDEGDDDDENSSLSAQRARRSRRPREKRKGTGVAYMPDEVCYHIFHLKMFSLNVKLFNYGFLYLLFHSYEH